MDDQVCSLKQEVEGSRKKVAVGKELGKGLEWNGKKAENGGRQWE